MLCVIDIDTSNQERAAKQVCALIELAMPQAQQEAKKLPPLFRSGVKYVSQDPKACAFRTPLDVYKRGGGDCKQLVLWRIAELRNAGQHATPRVIWLTEKQGLMAHAQLRLPDGSIEDPSHNLGMKAL